MSYRPITDVWILARSKTRYYGAYPAGFLHRARALLGVSYDQPVLHVCAGKVREYPFRGMGKHDRTLDLDPKCDPDYLRDARDPFPFPDRLNYWPAILIDRPYSVEEAKHYAAGPSVLPTANELIRNSMAVLPIGGRVGILDWVWPRPTAQGREVALIGVAIGRDSRARWYTVIERLS